MWGRAWEQGYCPATCTGQTERPLAIQIKSALTNGHPDRSAVAEHAMNTGHTIGWNNTQIKAVRPLFWQRCTLAWHMRSQPHPHQLRRRHPTMCMTCSLLRTHCVCSGKCLLMCYVVLLPLKKTSVVWLKRSVKKQVPCELSG